jgi:hypothetical protein
LANRLLKRLQEKTKMFRNLQFAASLILLSCLGASAAEIDFAGWTDKQ